MFGWDITDDGTPLSTALALATNGATIALVIHWSVMPFAFILHLFQQVIKE